MSQMDEIEKALAENSEFRQALEQEAQSLENAEISFDHVNDNNPPENHANDNENPELYRSIDSDVGNMNGMEIPDSVKQQAVTATQMDMIEAQEASEISAPTSTPAVEKENQAMER